MVVLMTERRVLSDQEIIDLVTRMRSLKWPWKVDEVERMVADFQWEILFRTENNIALETQFGMATGGVEFEAPDQVVRIWGAVSSPVGAENPEERAFTQDAFAHVVAAARRALGEPTQQIPGEDAEVRWRGAESTVGVTSHTVQVNVYLATNKWVDEFDLAVSKGL